MALVQFREFIIYKVNIREKLFAVCYNFTTFVKNMDTTTTIRTRNHLIVRLLW